jgi:hypothetical protein
MKSERVSVDNYVVRFYTSVDDARDAAKYDHMQVCQYGQDNRFVITPDKDVEHPELIDTTGVIFSQRSQENDGQVKLWMTEFVAELTVV